MDLMSLGPVGVLVAVILVVQAAISAFSAARNKRLSARSKRLSQLEPALLDLLTWSYACRMKAAARGWELPEVPKSVQEVFADEEEEQDPYQQQLLLRNLGDLGVIPRDDATRPKE